MLAKLAPELTTVEYYIVVGDGDTAPLEGNRAQVLRYDELLAAEQPGFACPEIDERAAAAMCYTSGTTGNPKGVVYSHRSTFLHSMGVLQASAVCFTERDRVLPVVPMFHANAWGIPYAAWMAGADLIMPNRFLQAEPLARLIEEEQPTCAGAVPTIWTDVLHYARAEPGRPLVAAARAVRRLGGAAVAHRAVRGAVRRAHRAGLGHDRDEPARGGVVAAEGRRARHDRGDRLAGEVGAHHRRRRAAHRRRRRRRAAVGRRGGRRDPGARAVDHRLVLPRPRSARSSTTAGSAPATSPASPANGYIQITDRAKDVIKSGGEWISSVELEVLLMAHPDVVEAAVIAVPDPKWEERPLACVVCKARHRA